MQFRQAHKLLGLEHRFDGTSADRAALREHTEAAQPYAVRPRKMLGTHAYGSPEEHHSRGGRVEHSRPRTLRGLRRNDFVTAQNMFGDDAQAVDEISRRWLRTREEIGDYFRQLPSAVQNLHSGCESSMKSRGTIRAL
jgi:hypothetical protein